MAIYYKKTNTSLKILLLCLSLFFINSCLGFQNQISKNSEHPSLQCPEAYVPNRIILNLTENPWKSQAVTWRTRKEIKSSIAQLTTFADSPALKENLKTIKAVREKVQVKKGESVYHYSAIFENLKPDTVYSYRVGTDNYFSEWSQFKTAGQTDNSFQFIYLGDPQNEIKSMCSQIFRAAYKKAPGADFWLFVGDLVDNGENDEEWDEFFYGLGFIPRMTPMILLPGNHEYPDKRYVHGKNFKLTHLWQPHFTLPENGPKGLEESVYFIDYQGVRFVMLNGNEKLKEQTIWLDKILSNNPNAWTIAAIHQPIYSTAKFRKNSKRMNLFAPVFDKHSVDLVLQGHDHSYSRTYKIRNGLKVNKDKKGVVYITSICGPKAYPTKTNFKELMAKAESGRQLFQVITIEQNHLLYEAFDVIGNIFDSFELIKK